MKIVFVLENYLPHIGGVEVLFKHLCEGLAADNHEVTIITHRIPGTAQKETINGVKVVRVNVPPFLSRYFFTFLSLPSVFKECKKADLIHTTTYNGAPPAWLAGKILRKPVVITVHEVIGEDWSTLLEMSWLSGKIHQLLEKIVVGLSFDKHICVSRSTQKNLWESVKKEGEVVYNGVDYDFWDPKLYDGMKLRKKLAMEGKFIYLFYGRPGPSKGLLDLIHAVPNIIKEIPHAHLVAIVSKDKAYKAAYEKVVSTIEALEIKTHVTLLDPVGYLHLPTYVKMADLVVVPSLTEGFGFTTAESCAMGKAVVASDTTSIPEVISGDYVLVEPKNSHQIAKGVVSVFNGKMTKSKPKKFTWKDCIKGYEKVYKELLRQKRKEKVKDIKMVMKDIVDYLYEVGSLKFDQRTGWWKAGIKDPETVAEHSFRTAVLAFILAKMEGADAQKAACICLVHDIPEARTVDHHKVAARYINSTEAESQAFEEQMKLLPKTISKEFRELYSQFKERNTPEGIIAKDADLLECAFQAKMYLEQGYKGTDDWIKNAGKGLKTKSAKKLFKEMKKRSCTDWFIHLKKLEE